MQLLEFKGIAKELFFKNIGVSSGNFRGEQAKTPLNSNTIAKIISEIPDINPDWLLTGRGEMLRPASSPELSREERLLSLIESQQRTIENLSTKK